MKTRSARPAGAAPGRDLTPQGPQAGTPRPRSLLLFSLGGQAYALPADQVQEVVPMAQLSRPPGTPPLVAGFLNLRGVAVPVLRLDRLFDSPELRPGLYTPLLVLRHPDSHLALLVEKVERLVAPSDVLPLPPGQSFNDCAEGVLTLDGRLVLLLSVERLLYEKEQQWLAEFQDAEQRRLGAWEEAPP